MSLPLHSLIKKRVPLEVEIAVEDDKHTMNIEVNPAAFTPLLEGELHKMRQGDGDVSEPLVEMVARLVVGWDLTVPVATRQEEIAQEFEGVMAEEMKTLPGGDAPTTLEHALKSLKPDAGGEVPWPVSKENIRKLPFYIIVPMLERVVEAVSPKATTDES